MARAPLVYLLRRRSLVCLCVTPTVCAYIGFRVQPLFLAFLEVVLISVLWLVVVSYYRAAVLLSPGPNQVLGIPMQIGLAKLVGWLCSICFIMPPACSSGMPIQPKNILRTK